MKNNYSKQNGFTILEILVSMLIGMAILGASLALQIKHKDNFKVLNAQLAMQTNAKFAQHFISTNLKELGAMGCRTASGYYGGNSDENSSKFIIALNNANTAFANFKYGHEIIGYESMGAGVMSPLIPDDFAFRGNLLDGSDAITIRGGIGETYTIARSDMESDKSAINIDLSSAGSVSLKPDQYAVISQCDKAEVFKMTGTLSQFEQGIIGHASGALADDNAYPNFKFRPSETSVAELRRVAVTSYYIADNENGVPALFRDVDNTSDSLVEGVERMQIDYGINTDTTSRNVPDEYHNADWVETNNAWDKVTSVRIGLIMRSNEEVLEESLSKTYILPGSPNFEYVANDKYLRAAYVTTISLRNRIIGDRT